MGRSSGEAMLEHLREFMLISGAESWLVWSNEEFAAFKSLYDKIAAYTAEAPFEQWIQERLEDCLENDDWEEGYDE